MGSYNPYKSMKRVESKNYVKNSVYNSYVNAKAIKHKRIYSHSYTTRNITKKVTFITSKYKYRTLF